MNGEGKGMRYPPSATQTLQSIPFTYSKRMDVSIYIVYELRAAPALALLLPSPDRNDKKLCFSSFFPVSNRIDASHQIWVNFRV